MADQRVSDLFPQLDRIIEKLARIRDETVETERQAIELLEISETEATYSGWSDY